MQAKILLLRSKWTGHGRDPRIPRSPLCHGSQTQRMPVKYHADSGGFGGAVESTTTTTSAGVTTTGLGGSLYSLTRIGPVAGRTAGSLTITRPVGARTGVFLTTATCLGQQQPARDAAMPTNRSGRICLFMRQKYHSQITMRLG
jgi:hypothetical protein